MDDAKAKAGLVEMPCGHTVAPDPAGPEWCSKCETEAEYEERVIRERSARRLADDLGRDLADDNQHVCASEWGLVPRCPICEGSGRDGAERCSECGGSGRATCECGAVAIRYENYQAPVYADGGEIVMGRCREPQCLRHCRQLVGLVGPLTGYEPDPDAPPGGEVNPLALVYGGYGAAVVPPADPGRTERLTMPTEPMEAIVYGEGA